MKRLLFTVTIVAWIAGVAWAEMPAEKTRELNAAGISDWQPGQNQGQGPAFSKLTNPIAVPNRAPEDTATMQYDDGSISALPTVFGQIYGNRFSQGVGGVPLSTITLNSFSLYFAEDSTADTGLFFQAASPGTTANKINPRASVNIGGLINAGASFSMLTTINVISQTALGSTGMFSNTFFLGAWCLNANTAVPVDNEAIGLATNLFAGGQRGYTADSGGGGTVPMVAGAFNAVLRANVTSPATVPVELMAFEVSE